MAWWCCWWWWIIAWKDLSYYPPPQTIRVPVPGTRITRRKRENADVQNAFMLRHPSSWCGYACWSSHSPFIVRSFNFPLSIEDHRLFVSTMLVCWDPAAFPSKRRGDLIIYGTIHRPPTWSSLDPTNRGHSPSLCSSTGIVYGPVGCCACASTTTSPLDIMTLNWWWDGIRAAHSSHSQPARRGESRSHLYWHVITFWTGLVSFSSQA